MADELNTTANANATANAAAAAAGATPTPSPTGGGQTVEELAALKAQLAELQGKATQAESELSKAKRGLEAANAFLHAQGPGPDAANNLRAFLESVGVPPAKIAEAVARVSAQPPFDDDTDDDDVDEKTRLAKIKAEYEARLAGVDEEVRSTKSDLYQARLNERLGQVLDREGPVALLFKAVEPSMQKDEMKNLQASVQDQVRQETLRLLSKQQDEGVRITSSVLDSAVETAATRVADRYKSFAAKISTLGRAPAVNTEFPSLSKPPVPVPKIEPNESVDETARKLEAWSEDRLVRSFARARGNANV